MLAQSFKTATELKLTDDQYDALKKVLVLLETDKLKHSMWTGMEDRTSSYNAYGQPFNYQFNMGVWSYPHPCGTIGCIGGTAEMISENELMFYDATSNNKSLNELFFPNHFTGSYNFITPAEAAHGLRNYLTTGDAQWETVG